MDMKMLISAALLLFAMTGLNAENLYECADNGGKICIDKFMAARGYDPSVPRAAQCKTICVAEARFLTGTMNANHANGGVWACTATAAQFDSLTVDHHGDTRIHCTCEVTCVKGIEVDGLINKLDGGAQATEPAPR